ncbi:hypothetical protein ACHAXT_003106 [Thalassiosira profunda]
MAHNAPGTIQIYSGLEPVEDGDSSSPPPEYWEVLRQSRHDEIDRAYWLSTGRGDFYADAMDDLRMQLEDYTRDLYRDRSSNTGLSLRFYSIEDEWDDEEEDEEPMILHYDLKLLSRWKMLFYAMVGSRAWESFEVTSIEFPKVLMEELGKSLDERADDYCKETYCYQMAFQKNRLDRESALHISQLIGQAFHLDKLRVNDNDLSLPKVAEQLSKAIADHPNLDRIDLSGSGIGRNTRCLSAITSRPSLEKLVLNKVSMNARGAAVISEFLASNPTLQKLHLEYNDLLDDNAAFSLAASLRTNTNMEYLQLNGNSFSAAGANYFRKVIFDDSSLNAVLSCNHTCTISGVRCVWTYSRCTKQEKKFKMICRRPLNHQLFTDVPLELMPLVLEWIQNVPQKMSLPLTVLLLRPSVPGNYPSYSWAVISQRRSSHASVT